MPNRLTGSVYERLRVRAAPVTAPGRQQAGEQRVDVRAHLNDAAADEHRHEVARRRCARASDVGVEREPQVRRDAQHDRQLHGELQRAADDRSPRQHHGEPRQRACRRRTARASRSSRRSTSTGAVYDSRNRWWLFSTPRHHADSTSSPAPGNRMRTSAIVSSRFAPVNPGAIASMSSGVASDADEHDAARPTSASSDATAPATRSASSSLAARDERGVDGNERRRQRAFAEQVLQEVRNAERRA